MNKDGTKSTTLDTSFECWRPSCKANQYINILGQCNTCLPGQTGAGGGYYCDDVHDHGADNDHGAEDAGGDDHDDHRRLKAVLMDQIQSQNDDVQVLNG